MYQPLKNALHILIIRCEKLNWQHRSSKAIKFRSPLLKQQQAWFKPVAAPDLPAYFTFPFKINQIENVALSNNWIHTEESKRRTLQRSDIAQAIANYDQFDFFIDVVPREDIKPSGHHRKHESAQPSTSTSTCADGLNATSSASSSASVTYISSIPAAASGGVVTGEMINVTTLKSEALNTIAADQVTTNASLATTNSSQTAEVVTAGQPI
ncbi:hypothetical protein GQX74_011321 [Glossina fuscipes]|nr:hypothetical protein GQX74_011321 [Glossina fuscipes]